MPTSTPQPDNQDNWFFAGRASSYPNITDSSDRYFKLAWPQPCNKDPNSSPDQTTPGCKVFHPNPPAPSSSKEIHIDDAPGEDAWLMREQVLVFQYKGKFHAVDHACPHRTYSLSWGKPFDIEDSGRVLGVGLRCRGHSYAFELTTGIGDRGDFRLGVWDVELRRPLGGEGEEDGAAEDQEVWVRRRKRREPNDAPNQSLG